MAEKTILNNVVCLVSRDRALIHLVTTEAQEMAISLDVVTAVDEASDRAPGVLLLDLDDAVICEQAETPDGASVLIGICRNPDSLSPALTEQLQACLVRPLATAALREHMSRWRGNSHFSEGEISTPLAVEASSACNSPHEIELSLENETTLHLGNTAVELTPKEAALMRLLIDRRGEIVSREALTEVLHSAGRESTDSNKTEVYLCFLRRKIERPLGLRMITTVRGKGYRLE